MIRRGKISTTNSRFFSSLIIRQSIIYRQKTQQQHKSSLNNLYCYYSSSSSSTSTSSNNAQYCNVVATQQSHYYYRNNACCIQKCQHDTANKANYTRIHMFSSSSSRNTKKSDTTTTTKLINGEQQQSITKDITVHQQKESAVTVAATTGSSTAVTAAHYQSGPSIRFGIGMLGQHTYSSILAESGSTIVLSTVAQDKENANNNENFLTVEYKQKTAGVGKVPKNRSRNETGRPSNNEILASRAIDRALRPVLHEYDPIDGSIAHYHVNCTVQATQLWSNNNNDNNDKNILQAGNPVATALNAASASLYEQLKQPIAAVAIAVMSNGSYIQDPTLEIKFRNLLDYPNYYCIGELLYAGTRDKAVMIEWTSYNDSGLPEKEWEQLLQVASASIQPILDTMDELHTIKERKKLEIGQLSDEEETTQIRQSLGLPPLDVDKNDDGIKDDNDDVNNEVSLLDQRQQREDLLIGTIKYCKEKLGNSIQRLFGLTTDILHKDKCNDQNVFLHKNPDEILSKSYRGRREQIMQEEIQRLINEYLINLGYKIIIIDSSSVNTSDKDEVADIAEDNKATKSTEDDDADLDVKRLNEVDRNWLYEKTVYKLLRGALWQSAVRYGVRSDGRRGNISLNQGWKTIRPLRMTLPALPDSVHGSAVFARGDTQVLCTVTLGSPQLDGQPMTDPYNPSPASDPKKIRRNVIEESDDGNNFESLPIGSLRFLRTQEALESDLNSRKIRADKERTGESGEFAELKRAFLQYDFPSYSTGQVQRRVGIDRRAIGHGALAERAILPILPYQHDFPYSIRMTSEVTDSNGSSSMASICGATLALLDAGVPLKDLVAGVSVGVAVRGDEDMDGDNNEEHSLLLDITGTEDHYGGMDFKIGGTRHGVTAVQLDVKEPLPINVLVRALDLAKKGRIEIIDVMEKEAKKVYKGFMHRDEPKYSAPRVEIIRFDPQRKRDLVGPGGIILRQLEERYGVSIDLAQEGQCLLFGPDREMVNKAKWTVMDLVADVEEGGVYTGTVIELKDFGAIIELLRNKEGLLHVSEVYSETDHPRNHPEGTAGFVRQHLSLGQKIEVLCIGVDPVQGSIKLSQKKLIEKKNLS